MHYPCLEKYKVTQGFGETEFSKKKGKEIYYVFDEKHPGLDFDMPVGEPVYATLPGWVYRVDYHRGMGKVLCIRYGNIQHMYGHLSKFLVEYGDWVEEGQLIALSGNTVSWGHDHLHFELRDRSKDELKDRPIEPDFTVPVPKEFKETFIIETTGNEAIIDLAIKFFGSEKGIEILRKTNPQLIKITDNHYQIPIGIGVRVALK